MNHQSMTNEKMKKYIIIVFFTMDKLFICPKNHVLKWLLNESKVTNKSSTHLIL